ncbi:MAG: hypothetical protein ACQZ2J_24990 [Pseudomonas piscis]|uniref:hypothetical protein n=1 Tax=Pseudomonas piscis TaxID=2614538 RepID=UPI003D2BA155
MSNPTYLLHQSRFEWNVPLQPPQALVFRRLQPTMRPGSAEFFKEISGKILPPHDLKSLIFIDFQEIAPNGIALSAKEKLVE